MTSGSSEIRLDRWSNDRLSLVCGLANAGGGNIIVTASDKGYQKGLIRSRKHFDTIPVLVRKRLGINCTIEPLMDGAHLCLEIAVPAATAPIEFQGQCYYYADGINRVLLPAEVESRIRDRLNMEDVSIRGQHARVSDVLAGPATKAQEDQQVAAEPSQAVEPAASTATQQPSADTASARAAQAGRAPFSQTSVAAANDIALTATDEFILQALTINGRVTAAMVIEVLGVSESTVRRSLRRLREHGFIERVGSNKAGYWKVLR